MGDVYHYSGNDRFWHDPDHVLVGAFAGRQPKPFGAFLTLSRHSTAVSKIHHRGLKNCPVRQLDTSITFETK